MDLINKIETLEHEADVAKQDREQLLQDLDSFKKDLAAQKEVVEEQKKEFETIQATTACEVNKLQQQIATEEAKKSLDEERKITKSVCEEVERLKLALEADKKGAEVEKSEMAKTLEEGKAESAKLEKQVADQQELIETLQQKLVIARKTGEKEQGDYAEELQSISKMFGEQVLELEQEKRDLTAKVKDVETRLEEQDMAAKQLKLDLSATAGEKAKLDALAKELEGKLELKDKQLENLVEEGELARKVHQAEIAEKEVELKSLKEQLKEVRYSTRHVIHTITTAANSSVPGDEHEHDGEPGNRESDVGEGYEWVDEENESDTRKEADPVNGIVRHPLNYL
ncbi:hypothetical protein EV426DRAFT_134224 [Tirmania nivea]|nr:hypothetical protein EV426DRAFT_134224 [Tirmania nivea]